MKRNRLMIFLAIFLIVFSVTFVLASKGKENGNGIGQLRHNETQNSQNSSNFRNYGLCTKQCVQERQDCFVNSKTLLDNCKKEVANKFNNFTINKTESKEALAICKFLYGLDKESCKVDFKYCKDSCLNYKCKENETILDNHCKKDVIICNDFNCFADASQNCSLAKVLKIEEEDQEQGKVEIKTSYEILGKKKNQCVLISNSNFKATYDNETIQYLLQNGTSLEEIKRMEKQANTFLGIFLDVFSDKKCEFPMSEMNNLSEKWRTGEILNSSSELMNCRYHKMN